LEIVQKVTCVTAVLQQMWRASWKRKGNNEAEKLTRLAIAGLMHGTDRALTAPFTGYEEDSPA
jgi:hypothetical protein